MEKIRTRISRNVIGDKVFVYELDQENQCPRCAGLFALLVEIDGESGIAFEEKKCVNCGHAEWPGFKPEKKKTTYETPGYRGYKTLVEK